MNNRDNCVPNTPSTFQFSFFKFQLPAQVGHLRPRLGAKKSPTKQSKARQKTGKKPKTTQHLSQGVQASHNVYNLYLHKNYDH